MNSIVFDLNNYPDISLEEFSEYVEHHLKIPVPYIGFLNGKHGLIFELNKDWDNNRLIITAEIKDYSNTPIDPALQEALTDAAERGFK